MMTMEEMIYELNPFPVPNRGEFDIVCPNCGRKKLHINLKNEVFHCIACGEVGGGCVDFWGLLRGICITNSKMHRDEVKADYKNYMQDRDGKNGFVKREYPKRKPEFVASRKIRNKTYSELLNLLTLKDEHKQNLLDRGLSEEDIEKYGFKSYPTANLKEIAYALIKKGCTLKGVAGFYTEGGKWTLRDYPSGIIIPQKSLEGEILGFQVRQDKKNCQNRYLTISSYGLENGAKGRALFHFVAEEDTPMMNIILTEGPLKGDITHIKTGMPVLAIQGVNATKNLDKCLAELKKRGTRNVFLAFDMDYLTNDNVKKAMSKVVDTIKSEGLHVFRCSWNEEYKGIDDYLNSLEGKH